MQTALKNKKHRGLEKVEDQLKSINKAYDLKRCNPQLKMGKEYETLLQRMIKH
jgi:hypothetical protein